MLEIGALAKSMAGHDKNHIFIILEASDEYATLVDGKQRTLDKTKRKNKKHIQIIHDKEEPKRKALIAEAKLTDEAARRFIRSYKRENQ